MKIEKLICGFSIALLPMLSVQAQTFLNLNFEQANPVYAEYPLYVTAASALPDWTVYYGNVQQTQIGFNDESTGATQVSLFGTGAEPYYYPLDGKYSVLLEGGGTALGASISQTGLIPTGTQSLFFEAEAEFVTPYPGLLEVSIGGENVPFVAVGTEANYTVYGANISAWAGDPEQLTFSAPAGSYGLNGWEIDDIVFSTTPTPEPSIVALMTICGLLFGVRKWFARCR